MGEYLDEVEASQSYTCDSQTFDDVRNSIKCGGLENEYINYSVYSEVRENLQDMRYDLTIASNPALSLPLMLAWIEGTYYDDVIVSATDITSTTGEYVHFEYVLDEEFYNKYGNERYIFTGFVYSADGTLKETITEWDGKRLAFSAEGAALSSSNSYYDPQTGMYYLSNPNGTAIAVTIDVSDVISGTLTLDPVDDEQIGVVGGVPITSDGSITLPDGTKVYPNEDGTYTIDGTTYYPTYDLSKAEADELVDLLYIVTGQEETKPETGTTAFNYTSILESIRSTLLNVLNGIKSIPASFVTNMQTSVQTSLEVMEKSKNELAEKLGLSAIKSNVNTITTTFFGERTFNENGEVIIEPVLKNAEPITTDTPHLYFTLFNKKYDLFSGFGLINDSVSFFKKIVGAFLIAGFFLGLLRSIPSILMNVAEVRSVTNPVSITNLFESLNIHRPDVTDSRLHRTKPETTKKKG